MKTAIKTINKYINYVENTLKYDYNNGILEGIHNKIKVIKRKPEICEINKKMRTLWYARRIALQSNIFSD
ncbi:transposase [Ureibacillus sp. FSL W8-0352]|uniref:transposase n=1 Tax=Ureibacillus sp. FSL W8-0352 TaxID=2954596 RepID=UPI004047DD59